MDDPRAVLLVLDGVGAGEAPDAADYGDRGSDTLGNTARFCGGLRLPELEKLGLGNVHPIPGVAPVGKPLAGWGKSLVASPGKDSTTGHWEMMGIVLDRPFPTFPHGFPEAFLGKFSEQCGRGILGNTAASGTEIIERLGAKHAATGRLIVYTSADSVFQIAAHLDVVPLAELYRCCAIARELLAGPVLGVSRVIARPFTGVPGSYSRTPQRRDFSLQPPRPTLLDHLSEAGIPVSGVGKVDDLFAGRSIETVHVESNAAGIETLLKQLDPPGGGFVFANLVDFDTRWGHRNDPDGFRAGLEQVDRAVPRIIQRLRPCDLFIITADHGNDPTTESTDHSREYVPLLALTRGLTGAPLGTRKTLADIAATLADFFGLPPRYPGKGFLQETRRKHGS
jgi:phosphopentomutase